MGSWPLRGRPFTLAKGVVGATLVMMANLQALMYEQAWSMMWHAWAGTQAKIQRPLFEKTSVGRGHMSTSAPAPTQLGLRVSFCNFSSLLPIKQLFSHQLSLPRTCASSIRMSSSSRALDLESRFLMVASVVKPPTMIMVTLLCGRVLIERALWLLLDRCKLGVMVTCPNLVCLCWVRMGVGCRENLGVCVAQFMGLQNMVSKPWFEIAVEQRLK